MVLAFASSTIAYGYTRSMNPSRTPPASGSLQTAAQWASLAYALFVAGFMAWACHVAIRDQITIAWNDHWRMLDEFYSTPLLEWAFSNQNGHRVPLLALLFALDYRFFDGNLQLLMAATIATAWLAVGALFIALRGAADPPSPSARAIFAFACFAIFWAWSGHHFLWGLAQANLQVVLWLFVSLACLADYERVRRGPSSNGPWTLLILAVASAWLATFSYGSGAAVWVALIAIGVVGRFPSRVVISFVAVAALAVGIYTFGFPKTAQVGDEVSLAQMAGHLLDRPLELTRFALTLVGSAFGWTARGLDLVGEDRWESLSCGAGVLGMAGFTIYGIWIFRRGRDASPRNLVSFGIMAFGVGAAAILALARLHLPFPGQAVARRFLDLSTLFWVGFALSIPSVGGRKGVGPRHVVAPALLLVISLCMLPALANLRKIHLEWKAAVEVRALELLLDIQGRESSDFISMSAVHADVLDRIADRLRSDRRNLFADVGADLPGTILPERFAVAPQGRCTGAFVVRPIGRRGGRATAVGWGWDEGENEAPSFVVIADRGGVIRGLAKFTDATRGASKRRRVRTPEGSSWSGYVAGFDRSRQYRAYGVLRDGRTACQLRSPR